MIRKLPVHSAWSFPLLRFPSFFEEGDEELWPEVISESSGLSVFEDDKYVTVEAAVPGLTPDEIDITFERGILWIKGEKKEEQKDKDKKYYRKAVRTFSYRVAVPGNIDENKQPEATYNNGVLSVVFTKAVKAEPKKITIKSS